MNEEKIVQKNMEDGDTVEMNEPRTLTEEHHSHIAPILGVLLIVLVLILVGLYIWGAELTEESETYELPEILNNEPETPRAEADAQILRTVSSSDSIEAIEADVESTNLDSLDSELEEIERELNAELSAR